MKRPKDMNELLDDEDVDLIFTLDEEIASGSFGTVYKGRHNVTNEVMAIKIITPDPEEVPEDLMVEIALLKNCQHPNIVKYHGGYRKGDEIFIAMELCDSSVRDIFEYTEEPLLEKEIALITRGTLQGLAYMHSVGFIHRDIKGANILLTPDGYVKLVDFGVSSLDKAKAKTFVGTPYWMAPEVIDSKNSISGYTEKVDVWSVGITCIELAETVPPLSYINPMRALFQIPARDPPVLEKAHKWSANFHDFLAKCLEKNPKLRPTATELLNHPFVANCDQDPQILVDFIKRKNRYEQHGDDCGSDEDYDDDEDGQFLDESEVMALAKNDFHFKDSPPSSSTSSPISSYNPSGASPFDSPSSPDRFGSTGPSHTPSYSASSNGNGVSIDASNGGFSTPPSGYAPASPTPSLLQGSYGALPALPQGGYSGAPAIPQGGYSGAPALPQGGNSFSTPAPIPTSFGNLFLDPSRPPSTPAPVLKFGTLTGQPTMPAPPPPTPTGVPEQFDPLGGRRSSSADLGQPPMAFVPGFPKRDPSAAAAALPPTPSWAKAGAPAPPSPLAGSVNANRPSSIIFPGAPGYPAPVQPFVPGIPLTPTGPPPRAVPALGTGGSSIGPFPGSQVAPGTPVTPTTPKGPIPTHLQEQQVPKKSGSAIYPSHSSSVSSTSSSSSSSPLDSPLPSARQQSGSVKAKPQGKSNINRPPPTMKPNQTQRQIKNQQRQKETSQLNKKLVKDHMAFMRQFQAKQQKKSSAQDKAQQREIEALMAEFTKQQQTLEKSNAKRINSLQVQQKSEAETLAKQQIKDQKTSLKNQDIEIKNLQKDVRDKGKNDMKIHADKQKNRSKEQKLQLKEAKKIRTKNELKLMEKEHKVELQLNDLVITQMQLLEKQISDQDLIWRHTQTNNDDRCLELVQRHKLELEAFDFLVNTEIETTAAVFSLREEQQSKQHPIEVRHFQERIALQSQQLDQTLGIEKEQQHKLLMAEEKVQLKNHKANKERQTRENKKNQLLIEKENKGTSKDVIKSRKAEAQKKFLEQLQMQDGEFEKLLEQQRQEEEESLAMHQQRQRQLLRDKQQEEQQALETRHFQEHQELSKERYETILNLIKERHLARKELILRHHQEQQSLQDETHQTKLMFVNSQNKEIEESFSHLREEVYNFIQQNLDKLLPGSNQVFRDRVDEVFNIRFESLRQRNLSNAQTLSMQLESQQQTMRSLHTTELQELEVKYSKALCDLDAEARSVSVVLKIN
eukprot:TRINITY_DN3904_c0_g1_i1.p1 TRINITY_DN3904_c0_g1~~TRINITY_DN3904_c0_g1_i1.p1  ORF type:complete len:1241 (+),score=594.99 TRINITY_DN3904_c0_g1_i1:247-3969(+)